VLGAGRLASVTVGFERRYDGLDVSGRERTLVRGDDVRLAQRRVALQQWRTVRVATGERPAAEVDTQLLEASVGVVVRDERVREVDAAALTLEVENHLLEAALFGDDPLDVLDRHLVPSEPLVRLGDERPEGSNALDASPHRVMELGLADERLDQWVKLPRHQTVEVRDRHDLAPAHLLPARDHRRGEQLRGPRHARTFSQTRAEVGVRRDLADQRPDRRVIDARRMLLAEMADASRSPGWFGRPR
jgi:hypothetical protein